MIQKERVINHPTKIKDVHIIPRAIFYEFKSVPKRLCNQPLLPKKPSFMNYEAIVLKPQNRHSLE